MSKKEKLLTRFLQIPRDFSWDELCAVLLMLGFEEMIKSKTGGSRRKFYHTKVGIIINLHKPHPGNIVKLYALRQVIEKLKDWRLL
ncbi:type II toxin-antitoxin system HicA family toxin [Candidatus Bandiella numerosa]|uniref:type II toxin-antitoxin system HicA family toxin n=1 Tax=Candidatus Bandiella numerosa TaxID=2570586 RepID=UPI001F393C81|nr:type II toxin-antitoxin system HicA family toxin [Candidatus Bandiella numerosa]